MAPKPSQARALLTVEETAYALAVSTKSIRRWIADRRLPSVKISRAVRVRRVDVERIVEGGLTAIQPRRAGRRGVR